MTSKCPRCSGEVVELNVNNYPHWNHKWFHMSCENCHDRWYNQEDWTPHVVECIGADKLNQIGYSEGPQ